MAGTWFGLEHNLGCVFSDGCRVERWWFQQQEILFLRSNTELIVKRVTPDFLHITPTSDNAMLNGISNIQSTSFGRGDCFILNHKFFFVEKK
jgi:hypothetical protein